MAVFDNLLGKREVLERRAMHLGERVSDRGEDYRGKSYDLREIGALRAGAEALRIVELVRELADVDDDDDAGPEAFDALLDRIKVALRKADEEGATGA